MKSQFYAIFFGLAALGGVNLGFAQGTAINYQGRLTDNSMAATGTYDLRFILYNADIGGSQQGPVLTNSGVVISSGLFTVTLDFGAGAFPGADRWLEIAVRTNGGGGFSTLSPRQKIIAAPYAITAANVTGVLPGASLSGTYSNAVTLNNAANQFSGNGANLSNVNALTLGGLAPSNFWRTTGNAGTAAGTQFLGTTDNQPLELKVKGIRALRLEPNTNAAPNVIGGSPANAIAAGIIGATIAGGGGIDDLTGVVAGNSVSASFSSIGGGLVNVILSNASAATIGGGLGNTIQTNATSATVAGGNDNTIQPLADSATIAGGQRNMVQTGAASAVIGGGENNTNSGFRATIGGGYLQNIQTNAEGATIAGGFQNTIEAGASYASIGGGYQSTIQSNAAYAVIGGGPGNTIEMNASYATISGGDNNRIGIGADHGVIAGGDFNFIQPIARFGTISGGDINSIQGNADWATIGGGSLNLIQSNADYATISGGVNNTNGGQYAAVPGGRDNRAAGDYSLAAGRRAKANHAGTFVWADSPSSTGLDFASSSSNQFLIRAGGGVGIGTASPQADLHVKGSTVLQGLVAPSTSSATNLLNLGSGSSADGFRNGISFYESATLPAMSLGYDGTGDNAHNALRIYNASAADLFTFQANGNLGIGTNNPQQKLHVIGNIVASGSICASNGVQCASDRNLKAGFEPVNAKTILEKISRLPITRWHYIYDAATPHLGPMAQDFYAAFNVGSDDKHISTVDADGVALAAIQGLNQKLETQELEIQQLKKNLIELKAQPAS